MKYAVLLSFILAVSACKRPSSESLPTVCGSGQQDSNGHICGQEGLWKPMLGGQCNTGLDCPFPYNGCDPNTNLCIVIPSSPTVFATDSIRPGITTQNTLANDFAYNIMAKGYDSLNDWCMSQAQQSSLPSMRNIASWNALVLAVPDTSSSVKSVQGQYIQSFFTNLASSSPNQFEGPINKFSIAAPRIYDKNGNQNPTVPTTWAAWTGLKFSYCPAIEDTTTDCDWGTSGCDTSCRNRYFEAVGGCAASSLACTVAYPACFLACFIGVQAVLTTCKCENTPSTCSQYLGDFRGGNRAISCENPTNTATPILNQFDNWSSFLSSDNVGVFSLVPDQCGNYGFLLTNDCGGGSYYSTNGTSSKSILCISQ